MILQKTIKVGTCVRTLDVYTSPDQGSVTVKFSNRCKSFTDIGELYEHLEDISSKIIEELEGVDLRNAEINAFLKGYGFIALPNNKVI